MEFFSKLMETSREYSSQSIDRKFSYIFGLLGMVTSTIFMVTHLTDFVTLNVNLLFFIVSAYLVIKGYICPVAEDMKAKKPVK